MVCACLAVMIGQPGVGSDVASEEVVKKSLETKNCLASGCSATYYFKPFLCSVSMWSFDLILTATQASPMTAGSRRFAGVTQVVAVEIHLVFEIEAPGNLLDRE